MMQLLPRTPLSSKQHTAFAAVVLALSWTCPQAQAPRVQATPTGVVVVAVSRLDALLDGGITGSRLTAAGTVRVEPVARISPEGKWSAMPCNSETGAGCREFEESFLSHVHEYQVISQRAPGAIVDTTPTQLGDCWDYSGSGTYSRGSTQKTALAASSTAPFDPAPDVRVLDLKTAVDTLRAIASVNPVAGRVETDERLLSIRLNGFDLLIVERSIEDGNHSGVSGFGVFANDHGAWRQMIWHSDGLDRYVLGTLKPKAGVAAVVISERDSESQSFEVYTVEEGQLVRIFNGGGGSC